jgi:rhodanese-related sulfurtransferase
MGGGSMVLTHDSRSRVSAARGGGIVSAIMMAVVLAMALPAGPAAAQEAAQEAAQQAGPQVIAADRAMSLAAAGELVVVDVRSPQEWRQTGVPASSLQVTIHQPDGLVGFVDKMNETLGPDHSRPIALICARGNRSTLASSALAEAGYTHVYNIREGMLGSPDGPGWLARGLPTEPCGTC